MSSFLRSVTNRMINGEFSNAALTARRGGRPSPGRAAGVCACVRVLICAPFRRVAVAGNSELTGWQP